MSSILYHSKTCQISKKIINMINTYNLKQQFTINDVETLTNLDLINSGVEIIPTIVNNYVYYEGSECFDFIASLVQYIKYANQVNKITTTENLVEDSEEKCAICMGEFEIGESIQTFFCTHKFHKECSTSWRKKKNCCPTCNKSLS